MDDERNAWQVNFKQLKMRCRSREKIHEFGGGPNFAAVMAKPRGPKASEVLHEVAAASHFVAGQICTGSLKWHFEPNSPTGCLSEAFPT